MEGVDMDGTHAAGFFSSKVLPKSTEQMATVKSRALKSAWFLGLLVATCHVQVMAKDNKLIDSQATEMPSFLQQVCIMGVVEKGRWTWNQELKLRDYYYLHLARPINLMPPADKDPAFFHVRYHTYDIGIQAPDQMWRLILSKLDQRISLSGKLEIPMMSFRGNPQPPLSVFLNVSKIGGTAKCAS